MQINFKSNISFKEYYKYNLSVLFKSPFLLVIYTTLMIFLITSLLTTEGPVDWNNYLFGIIYLSFLSSLPLFLFFSARKTYQSSPYLNEEHTYEINEETISLSSRSLNTSIKWSSVYKIKIKKDLILIYTSNRTVLLIPRSELSEEQVLKIKEWGGRRLTDNGIRIERIFKSKLFYCTLTSFLLFCLLFAYDQSSKTGHGITISLISEAFMPAFGILLMGGIISLVVALIPFKGLSYQSRYLKVFLWLLLIGFGLMDLMYLYTVWYNEFN